jgi:hypothetical protein
MVCFHQIYCGEEFPASNLLCKVGNVPNGILVRDGPSIQSTIVATGSPSVFFLGNEVGAKPMDYRTAERCRCEASSRTWISRFGGGVVLPAVGGKLQVVQA